MARIAAPPAVDLAKVGGGNVWHIVASEADGNVETLCKLVRGEPKKLERDVDANVVSFQGSNVCAHCRAGGSLLAKKADDAVEPDLAEALLDAANNNSNEGDQPEEDTMPATTEKKKTKKAVDAPAAPKPTAPKTTTPVETKAVTTPELKIAISQAERAIATQPKRTTAELTDEQADKAFKLGKAIAADRWLLKKATAGKTSSATVAAMVERIEARVAERNALRGA